MRYLSKLATHILEVKKCQSFAHDPLFNHIRKSLELFDVKWEKELLNERNTATLIFSKMDRAFFHPDRFEILIDARGFRPEEVKCIVTSRSVEVNALNEDQSENAQKRTSLVRQYYLPQNTIPESGQCCFSSEGILLVTGPWVK